MSFYFLKISPNVKMEEESWEIKCQRTRRAKVEVQGLQTGRDPSKIKKVSIGFERQFLRCT